MEAPVLSWADRIRRDGRKRRVFSLCGASLAKADVLSALHWNCSKSSQFQCRSVGSNPAGQNIKKNATLVWMSSSFKLSSGPTGFAATVENVVFSPSAAPPSLKLTSCQLYTGIAPSLRNSSAARSVRILPAKI